MECNNSGRKQFLQGMKSSLPIAAGYFFISISIGIEAAKIGLKPFWAFLMSLVNLTSAGEFLGIKIIASAGSYLELILCEVLINLRYSVMAILLAQKRNDDFSLADKLLVSHGITDEIFAVSISRDGFITPPFMYGMTVLPALCWGAGTATGALLGDVLPDFVSPALNILIYSMFIAIIFPPVRRNAKYLCPIVLASALSCFFYYCLPQISIGFSVLISSCAASLISAFLFPIRDEEVKNE